MAKFVVIELSNMILGLSHGVYKSDEVDRKQICLCYSMADAITIADALNADEPVKLPEATPPVAKPRKAKAKKPTGGRKRGKRE